MRKIFLALICLLFSVTAFGQDYIREIVYRTGAPSGTCSERITIDRVTGVQYICVSGAWAANPGAVSSSRTISTTAPLTGGGDLSANRTIACATCAVTSSGLNQFAATTSAQLAGVVSNETGSGALVFGTSPNITTPTGIVKGDVGLGNVDNTSDANKPISTATQTALDAKQPLDSDLTAVAGLSPTNDDVIQRKAGAWTNRTPAQLKTDLSLTKSDVGLSNVDNTSDATKNAASVTLANKTIALGSNTVSGTTAQFNSALSDNDFATLAGSETLTNKTISGASNTLSNIGNASLTNSSLTVTAGTGLTGGGVVSLGGSVTLNSAPKQSLLFGTNPAGTSVAASTTTYTTVGTIVASASEQARQLKLPYACTLKNFNIITVGTQNAGGSLVATVRKNGVDTALTVTVAAGATDAEPIDSTNSVSFAAGDKLSIKLVNNYAGGASVIITAISIEQTVP